MLIDAEKASTLISSHLDVDAIEIEELIEVGEELHLSNLEAILRGEKLSDIIRLLVKGLLERGQDLDDFCKILLERSMFKGDEQKMAFLLEEANLRKIRTVYGEPLGWYHEIVEH